LAIAVAATAVSGCATTTPPTEVTATGARLHGSGFTTSAPAEYEFQYALQVADLGTARGWTTPRRTVPAHTPQGGTFTDFSEVVTGLEPGTRYRYRVCGREGPATADTCLNVRSLTTTSVPDTAQRAFAAPGASTFTVPAGVTRLDVDVSGAQGGGGWGQRIDNSFGPIGEGGLGGGAQGRLAVMPGQRLTVVVGGRGGDAQVDQGGAGGAGGGGTGGDGAVSAGGGGGGASDVRTGAADATGLGSRLVVGGGGGGGGGGFPGSGGDPPGIHFVPWPGGAGGGLSGFIGGQFDCVSVQNCSQGVSGFGGTGLAGGAGGRTINVAGGEAGGDGGPGAGGAGGSFVGRVGTATDPQWGVGIGAGGGGGGWYGGGGGGTGEAVQFAPGTWRDEGAGSGGGGSGHVTAEAVAEPTLAEATRTGDGRVVLAWVAP
jgi:hypothetical protein